MVRVRALTPTLTLTLTLTPARAHRAGEHGVDDLARDAQPHIELHAHLVILGLGLGWFRAELGLG